MAQMRFVNDSRRSGAKASKPKELKRLLTERKTATLKPEHSGQEGMVLWVSDSKAKPPVRAVTSVIMHSGGVESNVQITELTTARDILKVRLRKKQRTDLAPVCMSLPPALASFLMPLALLLAHAIAAAHTLAAPLSPL